LVFFSPSLWWCSPCSLITSSVATSSTPPPSVIGDTISPSGFGSSSGVCIGSVSGSVDVIPSLPPDKSSLSWIFCYSSDNSVTAHNNNNN
jgi:hypothetical protein